MTGPVPDDDVPICRAAKGALAIQPGQRPYLPMERFKELRQRLYQLGAQRWGREILLAVLLTIAAVAFIAAAMVGRGGSGEVKNPYETAVKPPPQ